MFAQTGSSCDPAWERQRNVGLDTADQRLRQANGIRSYDAGDRDEFEDVDPALAAFILGNEGLVPLEGTVTVTTLAWYGRAV